MWTDEYFFQLQMAGQNYSELENGGDGETEANKCNIFQ